MFDNTVCLGVAAFFVVIGVVLFLARNDPPARTYPNDTRHVYSNNVLYNEHDVGGPAIVPDPNNPAHLKDYRHMDPWRTGWNHEGDLRLPPTGVTRQQREFYTDPTLPVHAPKGVEGARNVKATLDRDYGNDPKFDRHFERMIRDHERADDVISQFERRRK